MLPKQLRDDLGDGKTTPSRSYNERLRKIFEDSNYSNETSGEYIGDCRLPTTVSPDDIRKLQDAVVPRQDDIFIVSYPKSGSTWMQQIVKLIWNNGVEDGRDVDEALPWIEPMTPAEVEAMPSPRGFKVHVPYHLIPGGDPLKSPAKYIYVYRNPKDALVSNYHFSVKFYPFDIPWSEYFNICVTGKQYFGVIFDHVRGWYSHKDSPNILLISYENLKKQTYSSIQTIAKFLGYDLSEDTVQKIVTQVSFDKMKANPSCNNAWFDKYRRPGEMFMRKGIIGDWKELFTSEQSAYVDQQVAKKLSPLGLVFEYN